jgi:hypothetical protein
MAAYRMQNDQSFPFHTGAADPMHDHHCFLGPVWLMCMYVCLILLHNWTTFFPAGTYSGLWGMILAYILRHAFNQYHPAVLVFFH